MKVAMTIAALAATLALALGAAAPDANAASPRIDIPNFENLRHVATDSVDITIDGALLKLAKHFARKAAQDDGDDADDDRAALEVLQGVQSVRVRSFKFNEDNAYPMSDIDAIRRQLDNPSWNRIVQVHKRDPQQDVDVFVCLEDGKARGVTVISAEPREFTIVNVVGDIDVDKFAKLEGKFSIPKVSQND